ncbi:MAG: hypothetical protein ACOYBY_01015 [Dermatophilaceae bacterium]
MSPQDRRTLRVGVLGFVVALALILGAWRIVVSDLPDFHAATPLAGPTQTAEATTSRTPQETFVVPSPPPVTETATQAPEPAPLAPQAPAPTATPAAAAPPAPAPQAAAPSPAARAATPTPSRGQPASQDAQVRGIDLSCSQNGRRVAANVSFLSTGPVAVSLTAGGRTESSRGTGSVRMHVSGPGAGDGASCTAVVAGRQVGPVPAGSRR